MTRAGTTLTKGQSHTLHTLRTAATGTIRCPFSECTDCGNWNSRAYPKACAVFVDPTTLSEGARPDGICRAHSECLK